ncbi:uncharacterized protein LOC113313024 [Papaver somniferum]|uniref:uncharacterized protein LOC113313024 n=1 Tax=Papaver somniferum TaxID=3469 RepID=UPI000E700C10|nr:uncharacterized protein LOC113313024 [Papaver somniferum]
MSKIYKGYGEKWVQWINWCVTGAQFSILVNGQATSLIKPSKGIRQGDPLSPFLFILVVEVLSLLLNDAVTNNKITGFQVAEGGTVVSHLQFADDTVIFLDASALERGADDLVVELSSELGCKVEFLPVTYLGMPIGAGRRSTLIWEVIIQRLQKKPAPWKRNFWNKAGRIVLIKSSLESLAVYFTSLFVMPASIEKRLNTIMRKFLWGEEDGQRRMSWVSWNGIAITKKKGGLGVRRLRFVNKALLARWHVNEYVGKSMRYDILKMKDVFFDCVTLHIKGGSAIRFWQDRWIGNKSFKEKYPRLFRFARDLDPTEWIDLLELKYDIRNVVLSQGDDGLEDDCLAKIIYFKLADVEPD